MEKELGVVGRNKSSVHTTAQRIKVLKLISKAKNKSIFTHRGQVPGIVAKYSKPFELDGAIILIASA
ncbi:MAG: hypothetical protein GC181_13475 [Bacteroidetes bacterium]|nr:hypothetical protein [Bacteroidota bacterium]